MFINSCSNANSSVMHSASWVARCERPASHSLETQILEVCIKGGPSTRVALDSKMTARDGLSSS